MRYLAKSISVNSKSMIKNQVRLSIEEAATLNEIFYSCLSPYSDAEVLLFGSRSDTRQKGGDLDLLIVSKSALPHAAKIGLDLRLAIQDNLGEQHLDILFSPDREGTGQSAFIRLALLEGVHLWP
jgi:hypothetical protein